LWKKLGILQKTYFEVNPSTLPDFVSTDTPKHDSAKIAKVMKTTKNFISLLSFDPERSSDRNDHSD
jgi:hypothetical protein